MRFEPLSIAGAVRVRIEAHLDERGFFARTFCAREFLAQGLAVEAVQSSLSFNARRGTVRGLHFQWPPSTESKLVRCVRGELWDVLLDLRPDSASYLRHEAVLLGESTRDAVFIPAGIAHGFQTLADGTEVLYQMSDYHAPELQAGVRWDDPRFAIAWPLPASSISDRDATSPDFDPDRHATEFRRRMAAVRGSQAGS